jgi:hypothetical protein
VLIDRCFRRLPQPHPWLPSVRKLDAGGFKRHADRDRRQARGALRGPGQNYSDAILALANGGLNGREYLQSGAFNQVARYQPSAASEAQMFKAIAIMALATVLALPPVVGVAQTGYGTRPHSHPSRDKPAVCVKMGR